jgi:hypothetical protein
MEKGWADLFEKAVLFALKRSNDIALCIENKHFRPRHCGTACPDFSSGKPPPDYANQHQYFVRSRNAACNKEGQRPFQPSKLLIGGDEVTSAILPGFAMDLNEIFEEN